MSVDGDEVRRIADLAKLSLADDEVDRLADEMSRILEHARRLREVESEEGTSSDALAADEWTMGGEPADGGGRKASPAGGPSGADSSALEPDPLVHTPESVAPDMREGFFTVPPPPGVVAAAPYDSGSRDGMADSHDGASAPENG